MKHLFIALSISIFALNTHTTLADETGKEGIFFGNDAPGKWIVGIKAAQIENDNDDIIVNGRSQDLDEADALGLIVGYEFARPIGLNGSSTIEFAYIKSDDAHIERDTPGTWNTDIYSLFLTYRSAGTLYLKGKLGLQHNSVDFESPFVLGELSDTSLALGIGLGVRIQDYGVIELEYSKDSSDNDLGILGLNALLEF